MIILIVLAIYTVLVLVFVPLGKIAEAQKKVQNWFDRITKK